MTPLVVRKKLGLKNGPTSLLPDQKTAIKKTKEGK